MGSSVTNSSALESGTAKNGIRESGDAGIIAINSGAVESRDAENGNVESNMAESSATESSTMEDSTSRGHLYW